MYQQPQHPASATSKGAMPAQQRGRASSFSYDDADSPTMFSRGSIGTFEANNISNPTTNSQNTTAFATTTINKTAPLGDVNSPNNQKISGTRSNPTEHILFSSAELRSTDTNLLPKELRPLPVSGGGGGGSYNSRTGATKGAKKVCPPHRLGVGICEDAVYLFVSAIYSNDVLAQLGAADVFASAREDISSSFSRVRTHTPAPSSAPVASVADCPPAIVAFRISPMGDIEVVTSTHGPTTATTTPANPLSPFSSPTLVGGEQPFVNNDAATRNNNNNSNNTPSLRAVGGPISVPLFFDSFLEARAFKPFSFFTLYPTLLGAILLDKLYLLVPDEVELAADLPVEPGSQYYCVSTAPSKSRGGHARATSSRIYNIVSSTWIGVPFRSTQSPIPVPDMPKNEKGRLHLFNTGGDHTRYVPMQNGATASVVAATFPSPTANPLVSVTPPLPRGSTIDNNTDVVVTEDLSDFLRVPSPTPQIYQQQQQQITNQRASGDLSFFTAPPPPLSKPPPAIMGASPSMHYPAASSGGSTINTAKSASSGTTTKKPRSQTFFVSFSNSDIVANRTFYYCDDIDVAGDVPFPFATPAKTLSIDELTDLAVAEACREDDEDLTEHNFSLSAASLLAKDVAKSAAATTPADGGRPSPAASILKSSTKATFLDDDPINQAPLFDADWNQSMRKPFRLGMVRALEPTIVYAAIHNHSSANATTVGGAGNKGSSTEREGGFEEADSGVISSALRIASTRVSLRGYAGLLASAQFCSKLIRGFVNSQSIAANQVPEMIQKFDTTPPPMNTHNNNTSAYPARTSSSSALDSDFPRKSAVSPASGLAREPHYGSSLAPASADDEDDFFYGHVKSAKTVPSPPPLCKTIEGDHGGQRVSASSVAHNNQQLCLSELRHAPSDSLGVCVLDRQNSGNPGPRYYSRGLNDSAAAAGNDHLVEVLVWQRVDIYASAVVSQYASLEQNNLNDPKPPPSIFREPSFVPSVSTTFGHSQTHTSPSTCSPASANKPPSTNVDLLDDFFGSSSPRTAAATAPSPPAVTQPPTSKEEALRLESSTNQQQQKPEPIVEVHAGSYYRYSKHTILRGTIPVRWTTTLPNPFTLGSLGHFEAKMLFDTTLSDVGNQNTSAQQHGSGSTTTNNNSSNNSTSVAAAFPSGSRHTRVTDLTSDYFATLWSKLGGGRELLEHLHPKTNPSYALKLSRLAMGHGGRASVIGADCAAFVPFLTSARQRAIRTKMRKGAVPSNGPKSGMVLEYQRPPPSLLDSKGSPPSNSATPISNSNVACNKGSATNAEEMMRAATSGFYFRVPRPRLRCVNLLRQKPENGEEDTLTQHFVEGVRRTNEVLFSAVFPNPSSSGAASGSSAATGGGLQYGAAASSSSSSLAAHHQNALNPSYISGVASSPSTAKLELVHVDWLRLCKEFGTSGAVGVLWANTIPFLCGGGGAGDGAAMQRAGSPFFAADDDGCVTTGVIIPSRINKGVARGILASLVVTSPSVCSDSLFRGPSSRTTAPNPKTIRLPLSDHEAEGLRGGSVASPTSSAIRVGRMFPPATTAPHQQGGDNSKQSHSPVLSSYLQSGGVADGIRTFSPSPTSASSSSSCVHYGNYTQSPSTYAVTHIQSQFLRINCADSLDRTNLTSFMVSQQMVLEMIRRITTMGSNAFVPASSSTSSFASSILSLVAPALPPSNAVFGSDSDSEGEDDNDATGGGEKEKSGGGGKSRSVWKMFGNAVGGVVGGKSGSVGGASKVITTKRTQIQQLKAICHAKEISHQHTAPSGHYSSVPHSASPSAPSSTTFFYPAARPTVPSASSPALAMSSSIVAGAVPTTSTSSRGVAERPSRGGDDADEFVNPDSFESLDVAMMMSTRVQQQVPIGPLSKQMLFTSEARARPQVPSSSAAAQAATSDVSGMTSLADVTADAVRRQRLQQLNSVYFMPTQQQLLNLRVTASQVIGHRDNVISIPSALVISACDPVADAVRDEFEREERAAAAAAASSVIQQHPTAPQQPTSATVGGQNAFTTTSTMNNATSTSTSSSAPQNGPSSTRGGPMLPSHSLASLRKFRAPFACSYDDLIEDGTRQVKGLRGLTTMGGQIGSQSRASAQFVDISGELAVVGGGVGVSGQATSNGGGGQLTSSSQQVTSNSFVLPNLQPAPMPPNIVVPYGVLKALATIYIACGDAISMSYTNTQALHTNLLRGFVGSRPASSNAVLSAKRRYENTFQDKKKARLIDTLLGRNLELHFPLLCSGPYYVFKLPIVTWRSALVVHGVPSWATASDVEVAIRKAWDVFVLSRASRSSGGGGGADLRQNPFYGLPMGKDLRFKVKTAQRYHHYAPSSRSIAVLTAHANAMRAIASSSPATLSSKSSTATEETARAAVAGLMPSLSPHTLTAVLPVGSSTAPATNSNTNGSLARVHVQMPTSNNMMDSAMKGIMQTPLGSRMDLGAPKASARARGASLFTGASPNGESGGPNAHLTGGALLPSRPRANTTLSQRPPIAKAPLETKASPAPDKLDEDFFGPLVRNRDQGPTGPQNASKQPPESDDDDFVLIDDADGDDSTEEDLMFDDEDEEEEQRSIRTMREAATASVRIAAGGNSGLNDTPPAPCLPMPPSLSQQRVHSLGHTSSHADPNASANNKGVPSNTATGKNVSTRGVATNSDDAGLVSNDDDDYVSLTAVDLEGLVDGAKHLAVILFDESVGGGHIQFANPILSLGAIEVQRGAVYEPTGTKGAADKPRDSKESAWSVGAGKVIVGGGGGLEGSGSSRQTALQQQKAICPVKPYEYKFEGKGYINSSVTSEQYHSQYPVAPSDPSYYSSEQVVKYIPPSSSSATLTFSDPSDSSSNSTIVVSVHQVVGNEYPIEASRRRDGGDYAGGDYEDDAGLGYRDAGGGGGAGSKLSAATTKAVSSLKNGLRSLVRNL